MTWGTHWHTARDLAGRAAIYLIPLVVWFGYVKDVWSWDSFQYVALMLTLFHCATIYLYVEYTLFSRGNRYVLSPEGVRANDQPLVPLADIARVEHVLSTGRYKNSQMDGFGLNAYHYALIHLKNGQRIGPLTCLQSLDLETDLSVLQGVPVQRRHTFVPSAFPPEGI